MENEELNIVREEKMVEKCKICNKTCYNRSKFKEVVCVNKTCKDFWKNKLPKKETEKKGK